MSSTSINELSISGRSNERNPKDASSSSTVSVASTPGFKAFFTRVTSNIKFPTTPFMERNVVSTRAANAAPSIPERVPAFIAAPSLMAPRSKEHVVQVATVTNLMAVDAVDAFGVKNETRQSIVSPDDVSPASVATDPPDDLEFGELGYVSVSKRPSASAPSTVAEFGHGVGGAPSQKSAAGFKDIAGRRFDPGSAYRASTSVQTVWNDDDVGQFSLPEVNQGFSTYVSVGTPRSSKFVIPDDVMHVTSAFTPVGSGSGIDVTRPIDDATLYAMAHQLQARQDFGYVDVMAGQDQDVVVDDPEAWLASFIASAPDSTPVVDPSYAATGDPDTLAALLASPVVPTKRDDVPSVASGSSGADDFGLHGVNTSYRTPSVASVPPASSRVGGGGVSNQFSFSRSGSRASASVESSHDWLDGFTTAAGGMVVPKRVTRGNGIYSFLAKGSVPVDVKTAAGNTCYLSFRDDALDVKLEKHRRKQAEDLGYQEQVDAMTKGDKEKIGISQWGVTKDGDKGNISASASVVNTIHQTADKLEQLHKSCVEWDYTSIFMVPVIKKDVDLDMSQEELAWTHPDDLFDFDQDNQCLFTEHRLITYEQVKFWQRFLTVGSPFVDEEDRNSNKYLYKYVRNSLTTDLSKLVVNKHKELFTAEERGGAAFLWVLLQIVFQGNSGAADALVNELNQWKKVGPRTTKSENFIRINNRMKRIIPELKHSNRLVKTMIRDVYTGMQLCSCPLFVERFKKKDQDLLVAEIETNFVVASVAASTLSQEQLCDKLLSIFEEAERLYTVLSANGEWKGVKGKELSYHLSEGGRSDFEISCWNCGGAHHLDECPKPHNAKTIAANKKAYYEKKKKPSKQDIPTRDSSGNTKKEGDTNARKPATNNDRLNSNGKFEYKCTLCKTNRRAYKWTNHPTHHHNNWLSNQDSFCMATADPSDPVVAKQKAYDAQLLAARSSAGGAAASGTSAGGTAASGPRLTKAAFDEFASKSAKLMEVITERPNTFEASQARAALISLQSEFKQGF